MHYRIIINVCVCVSSGLVLTLPQACFRRSQTQIWIRHKGSRTDFIMCESISQISQYVIVYCVSSLYRIGIRVCVCVSTCSVSTRPLPSLPRVLIHSTRCALPRRSHLAAHCINVPTYLINLLSTGHLANNTLEQVWAVL